MPGAQRDYVASATAVWNMCIVQRDRIILGDAPAWFERMLAGRAARFFAAVGAVLLMAGSVKLMVLIAGVWEFGSELHQILLFAAIIVSSLIGGLGPGLLATLLGCASGYFIEPPLVPPQLRVLAVEGLLVSLLGGTLRVARGKARERLAANLGLEQQILEIGDDERRRIGHDLHDGLGQHLTGISLLSETMSQQLESGKSPDRANVENITRLVSEAVGITRDLAKSLSPVTLERDGFVAAIEELTETSSTLLGIDCTGEFPQTDLNLDRTRSLHLYRIVQEAVNNSVRHGKARHVKVMVQRQQGALLVTVADDGSGLSQKTIANPGLGLRIMQYRARMLGATLAVEKGNPGAGTVVICTCPLN
jgi:signal transduction histidine kinase